MYCFYCIKKRWHAFVHPACDSAEGRPWCCEILTFNRLKYFENVCFEFAHLLPEMNTTVHNFKKSFKRELINNMWE